MGSGETFHIPDAAAMQAFGRAFARDLRQGDVVLLHGDLGAGKTTLAQGIAAGLGVAGSVQSPTFAIIGEYEGIDHEGRSLRVYHLDLYRLDDPDELQGIGYDQFLAPADGFSIIEWPERAGDWLPERFWLLRIVHDEAGGRVIVRSRHDPAS